MASTLIIDEANRNLVEITNSIVKLSASLGVNYDDLIEKTTSKVMNAYTIPTDSGELVTEGIFRNNDIGVAFSKAKKDTFFNTHDHHETEIVYLKSGAVSLFLDGVVKTLKPGDVFTIYSNTQHSALFTEDSTFLAVTIPASKTWPKGKQGEENAGK